MAKVKKLPYAGKDGTEREFIKLVHDLAGYRNHREVFDDFLELAFCAIAKTTYPPGHEDAEALEARYMETVKRSKPEYIRRMPELLGILMMAHGQAHGAGDFLGRVSGEIGALNGYQGQFFTPYEVTKMMARITLDNDETRAIIERQGFVTMCEPACGAGGMVLAAAEVLEEMQFDPSLHLFVHAVDISHTAYKMAYLQLAMRGIPAEVYLGDSIRMEMRDSQITPAKLRFVLHHGERWREWCETSVIRAEQSAQEKTARLALTTPERTTQAVTPAVTQMPAKPKPAAAQMSLF